MESQFWTASALWMIEGTLAGILDPGNPTRMGFREWLRQPGRRISRDNLRSRMPDLIYVASGMTEAEADQIELERSWEDMLGSVLPALLGVGRPGGIMGRNPAEGQMRRFRNQMGEHDTLFGYLRQGILDDLVGLPELNWGPITFLPTPR